MGQTMTVQKREIEADEHGGAQQRTSMVPAVYIERARKLFARSPKNPILRPEDMPFPCKAVCNPGACLVGGEAVLLLRVIDDLDHSHLHVARSKGGIGGWRIEKTPLLSPNEGAAWYEDWGCEDPRLTFLKAGASTSSPTSAGRGAGVCLATTRDFRTATRLGLAIHPYNKDAVLFPRSIGGKYHLLHRPTAGPQENI